MEIKNVTSPGGLNLAAPTGSASVVSLDLKIANCKITPVISSAVEKPLLFSKPPSSRLLSLHAVAFAALPVTDLKNTTSISLNTPPG